MPAVFVTASGTDIGKTYVTAGLAERLRARKRQVAVLKPIVSGFDPDNFATTDPAVLLQAIGVAPELAAIDAIAPWRFAAPFSPDMAAAQDGKTIDVGSVVDFCCKGIATADIMLIEGIGGLMVPLAGTQTIADLIAALAIPAILVTGTYVGSLSHTLTALEVMRHRAIPLAAVIVNESAGSAASLDATEATLRRFVPDSPIFGLRRDVPSANRAAFDLVADCLFS